MSKIEVGNLYDMNKTLVQQKEIKLNKKILNEKKELIKDFIDNNNLNYMYYMLLSNEKRDYTIFDFHNGGTSKSCAECLIDECLANRGEIRGIDLTKDNDAIEI